MSYMIYHLLAGSAVDMWPMGVIAYFILSGSLPFVEVKTTTIHTFIYKVIFMQRMQKDKHQQKLIKLITKTKFDFRSSRLGNNDVIIMWVLLNIWIRIMVLFLGVIYVV